MKALNNAGDSLDGVIAAQVAIAQQSGINIETVDPRPDFEAGHEVCSNANVAANSSGSWINPYIASGPFHPNDTGEADFAQLVEASI
jgi:hypothetical protein